MHPINLHYQDDIYYLALAAILQHNMMVEACLEYGEEECATMYITVEESVAESGNVGCDDEAMDVKDDVNKGEFDLEDRNFRYELAHKRWMPLYDHEGTAKLKASMTRHLY